MAGFAANPIAMAARTRLSMRREAGTNRERRMPVAMQLHLMRARSQTPSLLVLEPAHSSNLIFNSSGPWAAMPVLMR